MRRDSFKLLVFAGIVAFAVLYGMDLSSKGIENVNGPLATNGLSADSQSSTDGDWSLPAANNAGKGNQTSPPAVDDTPFYNWNEDPLIPRVDRKPIVDRVSGTTARVLHDLSRNGIRIVVSLFDKVTG
jgi:hypothetical protein